MNTSPESDAAVFVRCLLEQESIEESPGLLEGLRRLRSFGAVRAPEPTGELATLLQGTVPPPPKRSGRRGLVLSFALAGAMAVGTTGVAASTDGRITCESVVDAVPIQQTEQPARPADPAAGTAQEAAREPAGASAADTGTESGEQQAAPRPDTAAPAGAAGPAVLPEAPGPDSGVKDAPATAGTQLPGAAEAPAGADPDAGTGPLLPARPGPGPGTSRRPSRRPGLKTPA